MPKLFNPSRVSQRIVGWTGGVNIRDAVNQLNDNELRMLENMVLDERGGATKRQGCESKGPVGAGTILSMYTFYRGTDNPQLIVHTANGKLFYTNDVAVEPLPATFNWTEIATGLSTSAPFSYETFLGQVWMSNGVDDYRSWDGSTHTAYGSAPKGKYLRLWKDTMWVAGVPTLEDRVYSSDAGDPTTFSAPNFVDIAKGDGDVVAALATDGQFLVIGKRNRTFTIYDPVTFANRVLDNEKGFESHFAVVQSEGTMYFLSRRGICQYLGDAPSVIISAKLDPLFSDEVLDISKLANAVGFRVDNRILFALTEVDHQNNNLVIDYYPRLADESRVGAWAFHRIPGHAYASVRSDESDRLYGTHGSVNEVMHVFADVGTDREVNFKGTIETGAFALGDPDMTKYIRKLRILCRGRFNTFLLRNFEPFLYRTLVVNAETEHEDLWSTAEVWGSGTWGSDLQRREVLKTNVDAYVRWVSIRFQDPDDDEVGSREVPVGASSVSIDSGGWTVYGILMEGAMLGERS